MSKMKRLLIISSVALSFFGTLAFAGNPQVEILPKWKELNLEAQECGGFSDDRLILKIKDDNREIEHEFCSSYGKANANIVKDIKNNNFLIVKFGLGRGTNAVSEYISVYRLEKDLIEYARIPVSEGAGLTSRWYYDYRIDTPKPEGLLITLIRRIEGTDAEWIPKEKIRKIQIK